MTQEEKAKAYDEAIEKINGCSTDKYGCLLGIKPSDIFPQLSESEDEKIRKELLEEIEFIIPHDDETDSEGLILPSYHARIDRYKSYLEKQKEQKPSEWNDADMKEVREYLISVCRDWERGKKTTLLPIDAIRARYFLEHLVEPKQPESSNSEKPNDHAEWSEEDKKTIDEAVDCIENYAEYVQGEFSRQFVLGVARRVDSLRPQPHWKPSKEQMEVYTDAIYFLAKHGFKDPNGILESLYNELKKQMQNYRVK